MCIRDSPFGLVVEKLLELIEQDDDDAPRPQQPRYALQETGQACLLYTSRCV